MSSIMKLRTATAGGMYRTTNCIKQDKTMTNNEQGVENMNKTEKPQGGPAEPPYA